MFQYATARSLAHKHDTQLKLDLSFFSSEKENNLNRAYDLDIFSLTPEFATEPEVKQFTRRTNNEFFDRAFRKILGLKKAHVREPHFHFSESVFNAPNNVYLEGYWQSEKYFSDIDSLIRSDFSFREEMSDQAMEMLQTIENETSICVNVRRGDFVTNHRHGWHGVEYIKKAEDIIKQKVDDHRFFVFSDEIDWCKENLKFDAPAVFIGHNYAGRKFQDYLRLMAACKHFIIPNSSFAWWAVWFNQSVERIVIAPKVWFNVESLSTEDLIPTEWIRI